MIRPRVMAIVGLLYIIIPITITQHVAYNLLLCNSRIFKIIYDLTVIPNMLILRDIVPVHWYAVIAVRQVLQYLREFDAPAMQSCKPLPCSIGSCQNRRLRGQTLNRKPCHCGSIKGGWCMELPTSLDQPLQGQIACACLDMFLPV